MRRNPTCRNELSRFVTTVVRPSSRCVGLTDLDRCRYIASGQKELPLSSY
jgi:hypothetical protein